MNNVGTIKGSVISKGTVQGKITSDGNVRGEVAISGQGTINGIPSGGKSGQILRKKTDSDYDAEWANFGVDETLSLVNGILSVNTATGVEEDNTLPITSAAVAETVGNIEILLKTI